MTNPPISESFGMITETQTVGVLRHLPFFSPGHLDISGAHYLSRFLPGHLHLDTLPETTNTDTLPESGEGFFLTERAERALPNYPDQMIMPSDIKRKDICCTSPHPPIFWRSRLVLVKYQNPAVPHPKREISDPRRTVLITSTPLPCFNTTTHQIWILNLFLNNNTSHHITNVFVRLYLCI